MLADKAIAIDFFDNYLSQEVKKNINLSTLKETTETAINRNLKEHRNDLVFSCKTKDNEEAYIYLLIEHQSTPDRFMPARMLRYKMEILGKHMDGTKKPKKLPNIEGVVLYNGKKPYPYSTDFASCCQNSPLAAKSITYDFRLVDLASLSEQDILKHKTRSTAFELLLKASHHKDLVRKMENYMARYPEIFLYLSLDLVKGMITYIALTTEGNKQDFKHMEAQVTKLYGPSKAKKIFTIADSFRQEGRQEGKKERNVEIAKNLLKEGVDLSLVSKATGLSQSQLKALA